MKTTAVRNSAWLLAIMVIALAARGALGETFLNGLAGPTGLGNENSQGSSPANDRFLDSSSFIGAPYDWSGVGLSDGGSWATMISPTYFVSANHDHPTPGQTITFHLDNNPNGPTETYTVSSTYYQMQYGGQGSDLYLGELTAPVDSRIAKYPVLDLPSDSDYVGMTISTYGYAASGPGRVGLNNISAVTDLGPDTDPSIDGYGLTRVMYYPYYANGGQQGANESYLEPGDSGGPSFATVDGALALLGTHFVNDGPVFDGAVSGDSFIPFYINQLDADMVGAQVMTVVPEPASLILLAVGAASFLFHSCRRRKAKA